MTTLYELLRGKLSGSLGGLVARLASRVPGDLRDVIVDGVLSVEEVLLVRAFSREAFSLVLELVLGKVEDGKLLVYLNSMNPSWTAATLLHELAHVGLGIERRDLYSLVADEMLAYLASFKSSLGHLYRRVMRRFEEQLACLPVSAEEYELAYMMVPRLLAYGLLHLDYGVLAQLGRRDPRGLLRLAARACRLSAPAACALAEASRRLRDLGDALGGLEPGVDCLGLRRTACSGVQDGAVLILEGADHAYVEMLRVICLAARGRLPVGDAAARLGVEAGELSYYLDVFDEYAGGVCRFVLEGRVYTP